MRQGNPTFRIRILMSGTWQLLFLKTYSDLQLGFLNDILSSGAVSLNFLSLRLSLVTFNENFRFKTLLK